MGALGIEVTGYLRRQGFKVVGRNQIVLAALQHGPARAGRQMG